MGSRLSLPAKPAHHRKGNVWILKTMYFFSKIFGSFVCFPVDPGCFGSGCQGKWIWPAWQLLPSCWWMQMLTLMCGPTWNSSEPCSCRWRKKSGQQSSHIFACLWRNQWALSSMKWIPWSMSGVCGNSYYQDLQWTHGSDLVLACISKFNYQSHA